MNRFRKEERRRLNMKNTGPSAESSQVETVGGFNDELVSKVAALHQDLFPEEHDFFLDSGADIKMRKQGISPMAADYLNRVNSRRHSLGLPEFLGVETSISEESWDFCLKIVMPEQA